MREGKCMKRRVLRVVVMIVLMGCGRGQLPAHPVDRPSAPVAANQPGVANQQVTTNQPVSKPVPVAPHRLTPGEVLYIRHCAGCHGATARGDGPVAQVLELQPRNLRRPELYRNTDAELVVRILHGKALPVPVQPKALPHADADVNALLAYVERLPTRPWKEIEVGEGVYDSLCLSCHGIYGRGDGTLTSTLPTAPRDLSDPSFQKQVTNEELFLIISDGKGAMPGAGDVLTVEDRKAVVAFVRLFSPGYELYDRYCVSCHGSRGRPPDPAFLDAMGLPSSTEPTPTFDRKYFQTHTTEQVRAGITHMLKLNQIAMPHFAGELTSDQVREIVTYLRSLPPEP